MQTTIDGINITHDESISAEEFNKYIEQEKTIWQNKDKQLGSIEITLEGDEVVIKSQAVSNIRRVRRITGYLSSQDNFNDAKRAELNNRYKHM